MDGEVASVHRSNGYRLTSCGFSRVRQKLGINLQGGLATRSFVLDISSPALLAEEADYE